MKWENNVVALGDIFIFCDSSEISALNWILPGINYIPFYKLYIPPHLTTIHFLLRVDKLYSPLDGIAFLLFRPWLVLGYT